MTFILVLEFALALIVGTFSSEYRFGGLDCRGVRGALTFFTIEGSGKVMLAASAAKASAFGDAVNDFRVPAATEDGGAADGAFMMGDMISFHVFGLVAPGVVGAAGGVAFLGDFGDFVGTTPAAAMATDIDGEGAAGVFCCGVLGDIAGMGSFGGIGVLGIAAVAAAAAADTAAAVVVPGVAREALELTGLD